MTIVFTGMTTQNSLGFIAKSILIFVCTILFCSCSNETRKRLALADEIMEANPDSAMTLLKEIDSRNLDGSDRAYYSLLYTQAQIKTDILLDSDSLISTAYDYYKNDRRGDKVIRANFYVANIFYYQKRPREAMRYFLTAYEESKRQDNHYWHAKSAEMISDLFFEAYNYDEAEKYTREAIENFEKSGRISNQRYAICDLASILMNQNKNSRSINILDSLYKVCVKECPEDNNLLEYIKLPLIQGLVKIGEFDKISISDYNLLKSSQPKGIEISMSIVRDRIDRHNGITNETEYSLGNAMNLASEDEEKAIVLYASYLRHKELGELEQAIDIVDSIIYLQSSVFEEVLKESITGAQKDFYSSKALVHEKRAKSQQRILFMTIAVFLIIVSLLWWIMRLKIRSKKTELEANLTSFQNLKATSDRIKAENDLLSETLRQKDLTLENMNVSANEKEKQQNLVIESLFKGKWETLNMLCNEYFEMGDSEKTRMLTLKKIQTELKKAGSKEGLQQIENAVDEYMGGIMTMLRQECGFLKEEDFTFLSLVYAGLSTRAVCLFTNITYRNFYTKKSRISRKILESDAPHKETFISKMS